MFFAGAVGYALLKKPDVENSNVPPKETSDIVRTSTREFVERRKKRIAEMRAAQKAEQEKIPTVHTVTENADMEGNGSTNHGNQFRTGHKRST